MHLMSDHGLKDEFRRILNLDRFLAFPLGARRPSVFRLREWLEGEPTCSPEAVEAARVYGFSESLDAHQKVILKGLYQRLLGCGDLTELHHALGRGQVL